MTRSPLGLWEAVARRWRERGWSRQAQRLCPHPTHRIHFYGGEDGTAPVLRCMDCGKLNPRPPPPQ